MSNKSCYDVAIIDYHMGNQRSLVSAIEHLGFSAVFTNDHETIRSASKIILPGVGSYYNAMSFIRSLMLDGLINELSVENDKPLLGICLGMQILSSRGCEGGISNGLGVLKDSSVEPLACGTKQRLPHIGFNEVRYSDPGVLYRGIATGSDFYFLHSYELETDGEVTRAYCNYGKEFLASFECDHIFGVQFHPEKSQKNGLKILSNFLNL